MTIEEFLERQKAQPAAAVGFLIDLLELLDDFDSERCSTLAGKLRAHIEASIRSKSKKE